MRNDAPSQSCTSTQPILVDEHHAAGCEDLRVSVSVDVPPDPRHRAASSPPDGTDAEVPLPDDELCTLWEELTLPRVIEERMLLLLRQGRLSKWFSGIGQEAVAVGVAHGLAPDDWVLPMHRNLGVFTTRGLDLDRLFRQLLGRDGGWTKGRDRSFHFGALEHGIVGMISHLAAMLPVADGLALAGVLRGRIRIAATFVGDGATSEGDFHEACNLAAVWRLPVLFIVENNQYGLSTPVHEQYACADLADRAAGYGMPGAVVDGNDVLAVVGAVRDAAARARTGGGPTLIELKTFRMRGHEETSGTTYVPDELIEQWAAKDPIRRLEAVLDARGLLPAGRRAARRAEVEADVAARVAAAYAAALPSSTAEAELAEVTEVIAADSAIPVPTVPARISVSPVVRGEEPLPPSADRAADRAAAQAAERAAGDQAGGERSMRYLDAISEALRDAMRADPDIVLLGQDVAEYGGAFKVTAGFVEEFGKARVRNTPIIESGAVGCALGLALDGFRPVVEMQFGDFISCAFNQVVNNLATTRYRWGAPVPVVVRAPIGGGTGAGPFHSQLLDGWFTHVPGLKVVAPATPADAKGLLLAALRDPDPVLFLEHKLLYRSAVGPVPEGHADVPIGRARVARAGDAATVVTWGAGVGWALEAAGAVSDEDGAEVEVVDLRSLVPWDRALVLACVRRTGRALIVHEDWQTGGFGGEIASVVADEAFADLDAPVRRVGALDTPVPFSKALEALHSARHRVLPALRAVLAY
ncbi:MAG: dehydrogenase E1 component subunit alpha/beta [Actinobacteria bacterium]|nr:dehydrogenase E1 component subunit alpha/beta [Actinomycetota bacterium]